MCAIVEYHDLSFASSAASKAFSHSVITSSSCLMVALHCLLSKLVNVSSLRPLNFSSGSPLNLARVRRFQKMILAASLAAERFSFPSGPFSCFGVRAFEGGFGGPQQTPLVGGGGGWSRKKH